MMRRLVCAVMLMGLLVALPDGRAADEVTSRQALEQLFKRFSDLQQNSLSKAAMTVGKLQNERGAFDAKTVAARAELLQLFRQRDEMLIQVSNLLLLQAKLGKDDKTTKTIEQWVEQAKPKAVPVLRSASPPLRPYDYAEIDKHVKATPKDAEGSIKALAEYLSKGAKNDREKVRAITRWMVENVAYDFDGVAAGKWEREPEALLKVRATDCGGQMGLFETLAKACGLEVMSIAGKIRDADVNPLFKKYTTSSPLGLALTSHGWNAVKLDGHWYMVDVTHINPRAKRGGKVEANTEPNWTFFLTPPHQFIWSRWPDQEKQQLLDEPVKKDDYEWLPLYRPALFEHKIEPVSHTASVVMAGDELVMTFQVPKGLLLAARLEQDGKDVGGRWTMVERDGGNVVVRVVFPRQGIYSLGLYVRSTARMSETLEDVIHYRIEAVGGQPKHGGFPEVGPLTQERGVRIHVPLTGGMKDGETVSFLVSLPGATAASVQSGKKATALVGKDGIFIGAVKASAGDLTLGVKYPDQKQYVPVARYKVE